jgi:hypothetical protein
LKFNLASPRVGQLSAQVEGGRRTRTKIHHSWHYFRIFFTLVSDAI